MTPLTTKPSTPRLSELARHVAVPSGVVSTAWPAVEHKCRDLGIRFRPWQPPVGRVILAKRADGKYAATIGGTGLSIPRQVGKTFLVGAIVFALCLLFPNLTVIWTAHRLRTAEETFKKMLAMSRRKRIAPYMLRPVLGSGEEEIRFRNGSRILFGARERGFGRGFDEVDVLIFDEAQILGENALDDMVPATNQSRHPAGALLLFMGTPPKPTDPGDVFTRKRMEALSGEDGDTGWIEFGADPDYRPPDLPAPLTEADWRQVAKANPSYPHDTPREAILRMRKNLGPDSYPREGLGIWDDGPRNTVLPGIERCFEAPGEIVGPPAIVLDIALDRSASAIAVAGVRDDGRVQAELVEYAPGTAWTVDRCVELHQAWGTPIAFAANGPAKDKQPDLEKAGVPILALPSPEVGSACSSMRDAARDRTVVLLLDETGAADEALMTAVAGAKTKGGESFVFTRKGETDISPLYAVTLARWVASTRSDVLASVW